MAGGVHRLSYGPDEILNSDPVARQSASGRKEPPDLVSAIRTAAHRSDRTDIISNRAPKCSPSYPSIPKQ